MWFNPIYWEGVLLPCTSWQLGTAGCPTAARNKRRTDHISRSWSEKSPELKTQILTRRNSEQNHFRLWELQIMVISEQEQSPRRQLPRGFGNQQLWWQQWQEFQASGPCCLQDLEDISFFLLAIYIPLNGSFYLLVCKPLGRVLVVLFPRDHCKVSYTNIDPKEK